MKPADIILQQLGGRRRLSAMIGMYDVFSDNDGQTLCFKFKGCRRASYCRITLTPDDTYDVEFIKPGRLNRKTWDMSPSKTIAKFEGIYCDMLHETFESTTGLYLTLCPTR